MKKCQSCYVMRKLGKLRKLVDTDIQGLYGSMAIVLVRDRGWKVKTVISLINSIQKEWHESASTAGETMPERCKRITDIDIVQMTKGSDNDGTQRQE